MTQQRSALDLTDWRLKERDAGLALADDFAARDDWLRATAPGVAQQDLLAAGRIPDPFYGENERDIQWVGDRDWLYRCVFTLDAGWLSDEPATSVELVFEGLDTIATVWLNGDELLRSDNMFVAQRVPVRSLLREGENELRILFEAAERVGWERANDTPEMAAARPWGGNRARVFVRKAQYAYGWDWGPKVMTAGPWRPVRLERYTLRIEDLACLPEVADDLRSARLPVELTLAGALEGLADLDARVHLALFDPTGALADEVTLPASGATLRHSFALGDPKLWWPNGYGAQPLYQLVATLRQGDQTDGQELARRELRLGLRRLRLLQEPDAGGTSFLFEVNNTPIFCGGANWIPADALLPRITAADYRAWAQTAADAHMVMLRVWGGGIYEEEAFFDACDELGLLVWHDFLFACGVYPAQPAFLASVRAEAEQNVLRLRSRACLALWCGNNEDYSAGASFGYDPSVTRELAASPFPSREIYEVVLPEVCAALDPSRPYWRGSPYGGSPDGGAGNVGDQHVWSVWHAEMRPYQEYATMDVRFVSEFGMQGFPDRLAFEECAPPEELTPQSRTVEFHNKGGDGPARIYWYLSALTRVPDDLDGMIYASQLLQAEAVATAFRGWRRRWRSSGASADAPIQPTVGGALVWQLNDCWPVISWALLDYRLRPKAAYYATKRALAPITVELAERDPSRDIQVNWGMFLPQTHRAAAWAVNATATELDMEVVLRHWSLDGELRDERTLTARLPANRATELGDAGWLLDERSVVGAYLVHDGETVARAAFWPAPFKYVTLADPGVEIAREGETLRLSVARPAKCVRLAVEGAGEPRVRWSDNCFDLLPGDTYAVEARGLRADDTLRVTSLQS